jgi:hypothetical protein
MRVFWHTSCLGLATAITSGAFLPDLEQRIRGASSVSVTFQPTTVETQGSTESERAFELNPPGRSGAQNL